MLSTRNIAMLMFLLAFIAMGCSDEDEGDPEGVGSGKPPAAMVGTWIFQSVTVNGTAAALDTTMEWKPGAVEARFHVQTNSAYWYEEVDTRGGQLWGESGFVFIDGTEMDINVQQNSDGPVSETVRAGWTLGGGTLTLTEVVGGDTIVFTLTM